LRIEWHWCAAAPFGKLLNRSQAEQADARQQLDYQTQLPIRPGRRIDPCATGALNCDGRKNEEQQP
jgi:hypothetical protein